MERASNVKIHTMMPFANLGGPGSLLASGLKLSVCSARHMIADESILFATTTEIGTFLGVRRIVFDLNDFSGVEKQEAGTQFVERLSASLFEGVLSLGVGRQVRHILHLQGISTQPRSLASIVIFCWRAGWAS